MTALYIIFGLIVVLLLIGFVWYYIQEFAGALFSNGCGSGCGMSLIIILLIIGGIIYFIMECVK